MGTPLTVATVIAGMTLAASSAGDPGWTPQTELDCRPYAEMIDHLKESGQVPIGRGVLHDTRDPDAGALMIVATPHGEDWTLVALTSDGLRACVSGAWGHNWQQSLVGRRMPSNLPVDGKPRMD